MPTGSRFAKSAPAKAKYLMLTTNEDLPKGRRFVPVSPLTATDGGDNADYTLSVTQATSAVDGVIRLTGQLGGTATSPDVRGIRADSGGPGLDAVLLGIGTIADGQVLARSGSSIVGQAALSPSGGTMSGNLAMGGNRITNLGSATSGSDAVTLDQLNAAVHGLDWQNSVLARQGTPPVETPSVGDRYLITTGTGDWAGHDDEIATRGPSGWLFTAPEEGFTVHDDDSGRDYNYHDGAWVDIGATIDHGALLNLTSGDPHTQYLLRSEADSNLGFASLDAEGLVVRPVKAIRTISPGSAASGDVWINNVDLKFQDASGSPATQTVERTARRNQNNGYAGLDGNGIVTSPAGHLRRGTPPSTPNAGEVFLDGRDLKYRDDTGPNVTQTVERLTNRNIADGYAGLDSSGRVVPPAALHSTTHATGGSDPISPASIGAVPDTRSVTTTGGLTGGGALSADRSLSIAGFAGAVAKDHDPATSTWTSEETKIHLTIDAGENTMLLPMLVRLPPCVDAALVTEVVLVMSDSSVTNAVSNTSTTTAVEIGMEDLTKLALGHLGVDGTHDTKRIQKVRFQTRNTTTGTVADKDIGHFRLRAWAFPKGGGASF